MISDYTMYLVGLRDSLIRNGVSLPPSKITGYSALCRLESSLEELLWFYSKLAISNSDVRLRDFILPLDGTFTGKMRPLLYKEYRGFSEDMNRLSLSRVLSKKRIKPIVDEPVALFEDGIEEIEPVHYPEEDIGVDLLDVPEDEGIDLSDEVEEVEVSIDLDDMLEEDNGIDLDAVEDASSEDESTGIDLDDVDDCFEESQGIDLDSVEGDFEGGSNGIDLDSSEGASSEYGVDLFQCGGVEGVSASERSYPPEFDFYEDGDEGEDTEESEFDSPFEVIEDDDEDDEGSQDEDSVFEVLEADDDDDEDGSEDEEPAFEVIEDDDEDGEEGDDESGEGYDVPAFEIIEDDDDDEKDEGYEPSQPPISKSPSVRSISPVTKGENDWAFEDGVVSLIGRFSDSVFGLGKSSKKKFREMLQNGEKETE